MPHRKKLRTTSLTISVQLALHEKWFLQLFDSSLCSLRISVISALNISRDYSYAEITEIRRDRREDFKSLQGPLFVQSLSENSLRTTSTLGLCLMS